MSLVSEALRKARREADRQGRPSRIPASLPGPGGGERGTRFGAGLVLGASIALAAALLGAAATWWAVTRLWLEPGGPEAAPTPVAAPAERTVDAPSSAAAAVQPSPSEAAVVVRPAPTSVPEPSVVGERGAAEIAATTAGEPPFASRPASPQLEAGGVSPQSAAHAAGERVFVLEADVGYARLSLGYVVARPTDPFAEVNGEEVHVGAVVEGFTVEEITARGVRLRDARGPLELRLR